MEAVLATIQSSVTSNINLVLPVAGAIFALTFGISMIPAIIKKLKG